jgi:hypothetical protein
MPEMPAPTTTTSTWLGHEVGVRIVGVGPFVGARHRSDRRGGQVGLRGEPSVQRLACGARRLGDGDDRHRLVPVGGQVVAGRGEDRDVELGITGTARRRSWCCHEPIVALDYGTGL